MQIVAILGSPRKGNSSAIAGRFLTTAEGLGARTRSFTLNGLSYRGCQACFACKTGADHCVINDDLAPVLDAIRDADVVVLATPVYFGDVTGQFKSDDDIRNVPIVVSVFLKLSLRRDRETRRLLRLHDFLPGG